MGRTILHLAGEEEEFETVAVVDPGYRKLDLGARTAGFDTVTEALRTEIRCDAVVDLSSAEGAAGRIRAVADAGLPLVEGTTGLDGDARSALVQAGRTVAVVEAPNLSRGVAVLRGLVRRILGMSEPRWDAALLDRHHREKRDAPSGTARLLASEWSNGDETIEMAAFRQGGLPGEHTIFLSGPEEELVLTHRAYDRTVFARGALCAARFAASADPGHYGMDDVLGLGDFPT